MRGPEAAVSAAPVQAEAAPGGVGFAPSADGSPTASREFTQVSSKVQRSSAQMRSPRSETLHPALEYPIGAPSLPPVSLPPASAPGGVSAGIGVSGGGRSALSGGYGMAEEQDGRWAHGGARAEGFLSEDGSMDSGSGRGGGPGQWRQAAVLGSKENSEWDLDLDLLPEGAEEPSNPRPGRFMTFPGKSRGLII